jgi:hypothetical protein
VRWGYCRGGLSVTALVYQVFKFFTGLEKGDLLGGHFDAIACLRIAPDPRIALARAEAMLSKIVSTITSLSLRVSSASRETSSIRSAFVMASFAP